jgi:peptidyl-prolyl cis-trans isomerase A (cyclophilin A)
MNRIILVLALFALALTACKERPAPAPAPAQPAQPAPQAVQAAPTPAAPAQPAPAAGPKSPVLTDPSLAKEQAPATYRVRFETTKGPFVVEVHRDWAPNGADRFFNLVKAGFFDDVAFFRAIEGFMVQFGINGDPAVSAKWRGAQIPDDPAKESNTRGMITFATSGPNSRTTQLFINYKDNAFLDRMGFAPFGKVVEGMDVVDSLYKGYGEGAPRGRGPDQNRVQMEGNTYLRRDFPQLDYVKNAKIAQ